MPERVHGGVNINQDVTGSLRHFKIVGADFTKAVDANGMPVYNSAASIIAGEITKRATIAIMNPITNPLGMSLALDSNRASWTAETIQTMINGLGANVGVDHVDLTNVQVTEVPYDLLDSGGSGSSTFTGLTDTPNSYFGQAGKVATVNNTETGLTFTVLPAPGISDAPADNKTYGRKNNAWAEVISGTSADIAYIPVSTNTVLEKNKKYITTAVCTLTLPDFTQLAPGDFIIVAKSTPVPKVTVVSSASQIITTDIGNDTSIEIDVSSSSIFIYDGASWCLNIASIKNVITTP